MPNDALHQIASTPDLPQLLDVLATAAALGISERATRHLFNVRAFPIVKLGARVYVRRSDLVTYLADRTIAAAS